MSAPVPVEDPTVTVPVVAVPPTVTLLATPEFIVNVLFADNDSEVEDEAMLIEAALMFAAAKVPFTVVVLVPADDPKAIDVVEPETPLVPMFTVFNCPERVAPVDMDVLTLIVVGLIVEVTRFPFTVVVLVPADDPKAIDVVEPETPPVPMFTVFVTPLVVAPFAIATVCAAVDWPNTIAVVPEVLPIVALPTTESAEAVLSQVRLALSCNVPGPLSNMIAFAVPPVVVVVPTVSELPPLPAGPVGPVGPFVPVGPVVPAGPVGPNCVYITC